MAKGYWIARVDVSDPEGYKAYVAANAQPLAEFGGRFLEMAILLRGSDRDRRARAASGHHARHDARPRRVAPLPTRR